MPPPHQPSSDVMSVGQGVRLDPPFREFATRTSDWRPVASSRAEPCVAT